MQALRVERDGDLLRVTMARPERRNAFDAELIAELTAAFEGVGDDVRAARRVLQTLDSWPAPVVARAHGHALGGGCGLVACSGIVVAAPAPRFAFSEVKLGIIPATPMSEHATRPQPPPSAC